MVFLDDFTYKSDAMIIRAINELCDALTKYKALGGIELQIKDYKHSKIRVDRAYESLTAEILKVSNKNEIN